MDGATPDRENGASARSDDRRTGGQWWDSTENLVVVRIPDLERIGVASYEAAGASNADARFLFRTNLDKSIQGDHARGLGRVPALIAQAQSGELDVAPTLEVHQEASSTAIIDGGRFASGRLVCRAAMNLAMEKASHTGVALVAARSSGELLGPYVREAAEAGMVGVAMVQSAPSVAPLGGRGPLLGNAPLAVGIPTGGEHPLLLDMSLTQSSASGVLMAARQGQMVPSGILLDEHGEPTEDASAFPDPLLAELYGDMCLRGSLVPLGGNHKGYAMVLVLGLLTYLLSDTSPPWDLYYDLEVRGRYGTLLWAVDPTIVTGLPAEAIRSRVDAFLERVKAAPRGPGSGPEAILYPGERSQQLVADRRRRGTIAIPESHFEGMRQLADRQSIELTTVDEPL